MQLLKATWLCYWLISSTASSPILVTSASLQRRDNSNPNTGPSAESPNGSESKSRWPKRFRSSEAEVTAYSVRHPNEIGSYAFGYDNARDAAGNEHFRFEERFANGTVVGEYGFTDYVNSAVVTVTYIADENGFRPVVKMRRLDDTNPLTPEIQSLD